MSRMFAVLLVVWLGGAEAGHKEGHVQRLHPTEANMFAGEFHKPHTDLDHHDQSYFVKALEAVKAAETK